MTHLGLSKDHFVWSFNTVAQSIAFISLPSTKYVITGYIMTITCRKSLRSYFDSRGTFSGSGMGGDWGGTCCRDQSGRSYKMPKAAVRGTDEGRVEERGAHWDKVGIRPFSQELISKVMMISL